MMEPLFRICDLSEVYQGNVSDLLSSLLPRQRVIAVVDRTFAQLHAHLLGRMECIKIDPNEENKTLQTVEYVLRELIQMHADRSTFLLGIGGGITTDITGFVASIYMRGIRFGFVSTTLLGQVDASVGGKNGVNLDGYKNMVGVFQQPEFVICDPDLLETLPLREFRAGMAEVVKVALLGDADLFGCLEQTSLEALRSDRDLLSKIIASAIRIKADIVSRDERESGLRRVLNLGHTMGHAIEKCTPALNHGEAVAVGIRMVCDAAVKINKLSFRDHARILTLLSKLGFSLSVPVDLADLKTAAMSDKKQSGDVLHLVVPTAVGQCEVLPIRREQFDRLF